jgi:hypothetical protein
MTNIVTIDYELFGSGKGCVFKHLVNPTYKMLEAFDKLGTKATFFIEILEVEKIIGLKELFPEYSKEYLGAVAIEKQISELIKYGHDIQLHLHPQWYNAEYINGEWKLNHQWWSFSDLPERSRADSPGKYELLALGKKMLEKRVRYVDPSYSCTIFRAGGYNVGNSHESVNALLENNIYCDSSVCPGFFSNSLSNYDFTMAPSNLPYWYCDESIVVPSNKGSRKRLLELPLLTISVNKLQRFSIARVFSTIKNRHYKGVPYCHNREDKGAKNIRQLKNSNFDMCLSSSMELARFKMEIKQRRIKDSNYPLVLIAHPKDLNFFSPLSKVLSQFNSFMTLKEYTEKMDLVEC